MSFIYKICLFQVAQNGYNYPQPNRPFTDNEKETTGAGYPSQPGFSSTPRTTNGFQKYPSTERTNGYQRYPSTSPPNSVNNGYPAPGRPSGPPFPPGGTKGFPERRPSGQNGGYKPAGSQYSPPGTTGYPESRLEDDGVTQTPQNGNYPGRRPNGGYPSSGTPGLSSTQGMINFKSLYCDIIVCFSSNKWVFWF